MRNKTIYDLVKELLVAKPVLRNSDKKLVWSVWIRLGFADGNGMSLTSFLQGNCPSSDSITRARRKVVENHPELDSTPEVKAQKQYLEHYKGNYVYFQEVE